MLPKTDYMIWTNRGFQDFAGLYWGSTKVPDLAFATKNGRGFFEPRFVLEMVFSEGYSLTHWMQNYGLNGIKVSL